MIPSHATDARPWYREYWVWLLMVPPTFAVFGGVMMLVLAITGRNDLSVSDYSHIDEITSQRFARDRAAADIAVLGTLEFSQRADGIVTIGAALTSNAPV
jgi:hypothetical protein